MVTILLILMGELALFLIGVGVVLEWNRRARQGTPAQQTRHTLSLILLSLLVVPVVIGPLMIVAGEYHRMRYDKTLDWPTTTGQITESYVITHTSKSSTTYSPLVRYRYTVNNKTYTSSDFAYDDRSYGNRGRAEDQIHPYPVGNAVTVHYNPDKPKAGLIAPTPDSFFQMYTRMGSITILIGIVFLVGGGAGLWWWNRRPL